MIYFLFSLTVILIYIESFDCKNTQIVIKKLLPIEINENVPIGYTITDLKANLIDHHRNNEDIYLFSIINKWCISYEIKYSKDNIGLIFRLLLNLWG